MGIGGEGRVGLGWGRGANTNKNKNENKKGCRDLGLGYDGCCVWTGCDCPHDVLGWG